MICSLKFTLKTTVILMLCGNVRPLTHNPSIYLKYHLFRQSVKFHNFSVSCFHHKSIVWNSENKFIHCRYIFFSFSIFSVVLQWTKHTWSTWFLRWYFMSSSTHSIVLHLCLSLWSGLHRLHETRCLGRNWTSCFICIPPYHIYLVVFCHLEVTISSSLILIHISPFQLFN